MLFLPFPDGYARSHGRAFIPQELRAGSATPRLRVESQSSLTTDFESKLTKSKLRGNLKVLLKKEVVQENG
jgi:hypothetical protein